METIKSVLLHLLLTPRIVILVPNWYRVFKEFTNSCLILYSVWNNLYVSWCEGVHLWEVSFILLLSQKLILSQKSFCWFSNVSLQFLSHGGLKIRTIQVSGFIFTQHMGLCTVSWCQRINYIRVLHQNKLFEIIVLFK